MNARWIAAFALLALPAAASAQDPRPDADSVWRSGDRQAARVLYLERLGDDGSDAVALFRLGLIARWNGRPQESIEWFDRLLAIHADDRDARVARAHAVAATGDLEAAIAATDSILDRHPDDVAALDARARFAERERDMDHALRLWRRALALDPANGAARAGLAGSLRRQGRALEARREVAVALAAAPDDADVRATSDYIERQFRPTVRSAVTIENDTDGNLVTGVSAGAFFYAADRLAVRTDAWTRNAGLRESAADLIATGAQIGVTFDAPSGWTFGAAVGANRSGDPAARTSPALSAFASTPADRTTRLAVGGSRTPLDHTLPQIRNRVVVTEATASVEASSGRDWDFNAVAGVATFDARASDEQNRRISVTTAVRRRLTDRFAITLSARVFGFDRDIDGGFFDPDAFGLIDAAIAWHHEPARWLLDAEVAPGIQRIGSHATTTGAVRAAASATWQPRPGRQITLRGTVANTGFQQLSADSGGTYRYASAALSFSWWF
ncbi:MAG TPA: tetratricopeptide repeat protein [Longimicrobiales bacterium]|nr:tetratricopeptide repeat protein [Longimicrobiales bacterium]